MNKLIITVNNIDHIKEYLKLENVSRLIIGNETFGQRVSHSYGLKSIKNIVEKVHEKEKELYVAINKIFHESELEDLEKYIKELKDINIDGIIFSDFAVYEIVKQLKYDIKLSYSTDTTITNSSFSYLAKEFGIDDIFLAKEITLKEIKEINEKKYTKIAMFLHGHIYMYNGFRKLITTYFEAVGEKSISLDKQFYLYDEERNYHYPIVENENGTNILSSDDQMSIKFLKEILDAKIDFLLIDGFLYKDEDYLYILKIYNDLISFYNEQEMEDTKTYEEFEDMCNQSIHNIKKKIEYKKFSYGFLKKETVF